MRKRTKKLFGLEFVGKDLRYIYNVYRYMWAILQKQVYISKILNFNCSALFNPVSDGLLKRLSYIFTTLLIGMVARGH